MELVNAEVFSSPAFLWGVLVGGLAMGLLGMYALHSYKRTLLYCAQGKSAEKLLDGKFYCLLPESEYNQLQALRLNQLYPSKEELDVAGVPKTQMTLMEIKAVETLNLIKAWADDPQGTEFPVEARMGADLVLGLAQLRRKGVQ